MRARRRSVPAKVVKDILELRRRQKGFTLVELLVVIAIIGVLATLVLLQLGTARARARDTRRITDVNQLRTAAEQYFEDNGGKYPNSATVAADLQKYLTKTPTDPLTGNNYNYAVDATRSRFQFWIPLEQTAAALNGDADIDSTGWTGTTNNVGARDTDPTTGCAAVTTAAEKAAVCIYDQGVKE